MPRVAAVIFFLAVFVARSSAQEDAAIGDAAKNGEVQRWL